MSRRHSKSAHAVGNDFFLRPTTRTTPWNFAIMYDTSYENDFGYQMVKCKFMIGP